MAGNKNSGRTPYKQNKEGTLIASLAREYTEAALDKLVKLMNKAESEAVQAQAASAILDRGWGKPAQAVKHEGDPDKPIEHNVAVRFE